MRGFLYGQTEYNIFSSTNRLDDYINLATQNHFDFLTITDPNLYGHYKFYKKCLEANIKPIIGLEYSYKTEDQNNSKAILYALNNEGYKELLKITSKVGVSKEDSLEFLLNNTNNVATIFVFNDSFIERLLYSREFKMLDSFLNQIKEFKHPYIGISYTNSLARIGLNKDMETYANEKGIKCIPIHKCSYLMNKDLNVYKALNQIGGIVNKISEYDDFAFDTEPLESEEINNLVSQINLNLFSEKPKLPKYPNTKGASSKDFLFALCSKGLAKRGLNNNVYSQRLNYELSIINKMGYDDYFLIVWDFIKYAKNNGILVGPGRGSAAGSLVAYCLGITEVDPLKYDLLFERFLNPERVSMPDIDTDFPDDKRDLVIEHVKNLYGEDHVCNITAFGTFQMKAAIRELGRIRKMDNSYVMKIIDTVESLGFEGALAHYEETEPNYDFIYTASKLVDLPKHISTHAAGIVLSAEPLSSVVPMQEGINGLQQSQLEAPDLEKIGLLKMDFLGISNLAIVDSVIKLIPGFDTKKLRGIPLNDKKTMELFQHADMLGIFQFESKGIRNVLINLHPESFDDIVAVLALYRPGPMDSIDDFIQRKKSGKIEYIHPDLAPILKSTYGVIVYQEQIMQIARKFAGYSMGEADVLRRAVSKKKADALLEQEADFIKRSIAKGYSEKTAKDIYALILKFANYGFNKSHSVAYAILSYQMAYLKAHYFDIFMAKIMDHVIGSSDTLSEYITYARRRGMRVLKPDINVSDSIFVSHKTGIYLPFTAIRGIGEAVSNQIIEERSKGLFLSFENFKDRTTFLSATTIKGLIMSGALDSFGKTKSTMLASFDTENSSLMKHVDNSLVLSSNEEYSLAELRSFEKEFLGFNLEYNALRDVDLYVSKYRPAFLDGLQYGINVNLLAVLSDTKVITTKKKETMLVGTLEDVTGAVHFVIFPADYRNINFVVSEDTLYLLNGTLTLDKDNKASFTIRNIKTIIEK